MACRPDQLDIGGHCGRYVTVAVSRCEGHTEQFSIGGYRWKGRQGVEEEAQPKISSSGARDEEVINRFLLARAVGTLAVTSVGV